MKIGQIEKGIPAPEQIPSKYQTFLDMEIGDSVLVEEISPKAIRPILSKMARDINVKFQTQQIGKTTIRVWKLIPDNME